MDIRYNMCSAMQWTERDVEVGTVFVVQWLGCQTCNQQVVGARPGRCTVECNPGQVVYPHMPLSTNSVIGTSQWAVTVMPRSWEGNHKSGLALATCHRH